jgi:uncharacterized protein (DUF488 family)
MPPRHRVFTIGHSNLEWAEFLQRLRDFQVQLLVDVRSRPRSFRYPQFGQPEFESALREAGVAYLCLGDELGGRPDDPKAYRADGLVDYRARRKSAAFAAGIERVLEEAGRRVVALLCAEEDPIECHRFLMIGPELMAAGVEPAHIRREGVLESQCQAEDRLLEAHHFADVASGSLFASGRAAALEDAYVAQAEKCAFRADPQAVEHW